MNAELTGPVLDTIWTRFLAGEALSADDRAALTAAVHKDEILRRRLLVDLRVHGALLAAGQSERQDALAQEVAFEARLFRALGADFQPASPLPPQAAPTAHTSCRAHGPRWSRGALVVMAAAAAAMALIVGGALTRGKSAVRPPGQATWLSPEEKPQGAFSPQGQNAVLLVGTPDMPGLPGSNGPSAPAPLDPRDQLLRDRLKTLGFSVIVSPPCENGQARAARAALVVLSSTVDARPLGSALAELAVPMLVLEPGAFAKLGLTGEVPGIDSDHPLAAGLAGKVGVLARPLPVGWGAPSPEAVVIARAPDSSPLGNRPVVFGYQRGARMVGLRAPARRAALLLTDDDVVDALTEEDWRLFDAAAIWALSDRR